MNNKKIINFEGYYTLAPLSIKGEMFKYCCDNNYNNILDDISSPKNLVKKLENLWKNDKDYILELCNNYDYAITDDLEFAKSDEFAEIVDDAAEFDAVFYFNSLQE